LCLLLRTLRGPATELLGNVGLQCTQLSLRSIREARGGSIDNDLYVITHPELRGAVEERFGRILAAFDKAANARE